MSSNKRILAIALSAVLVLSVLGSGLAFAGTAATMANNEDTGEEDCEVPEETDENETVDDNESVDGNESVDANESEDGNETVDDNEADGDCGADDENATDHQPFGQQVTAYVHQLIDGSNDTNDTNGSDVPLGQQIATFVVKHNPGNAPAHAGPGGQPDHAGGANETGKPAHAGGANETGPPADAGPDEDKKGGSGNGNGGPPGEEDES